MKNSALFFAFCIVLFPIIGFGQSNGENLQSTMVEVVNTLSSDLSHLTFQEDEAAVLSELPNNKGITSGNQNNQKVPWCELPYVLKEKHLPSGCIIYTCELP